MARPLRVEYPGAFYHVMNRGNDGKRLFISKRDHEKFLENLGQAAERFDLRIHTYCLMSNHYHLLVETPQANLSRAFHWFHAAYATYFNVKRKRQGHVFQGRYKALLIDADAYLKQLSRYIHLNPLRANMVTQLDEHPWSSYPAFIGKAKSPEWLHTDWLFSQFAKTPKTARRKYKRFVEETNLATLQNPFMKSTGGFILGELDFVNWVKDTFLKKESTNKEIPQLKILKPQIGLDTIIAAVAETFECEADQIIHKGTKGNQARDIAIYLSRELTGETSVYLGERFGHVSGANITMRYKVIANALVKGNRKLKSKINSIRKRIIRT
jgi:REP-associated tyrosine transposase